MCTHYESMREGRLCPSTLLKTCLSPSGSEPAALGAPSGRGISSPAAAEDAGWKEQTPVVVSDAWRTPPGPQLPAVGLLLPRMQVMHSSQTDSPRRDGESPDGERAARLKQLPMPYAGMSMHQHQHMTHDGHHG